MDRMKKMYAEFKSIFVSEDLLVENEEHANIVTASTMMNLFWISVLTWILTYFNIFKIGLVIMNAVVLRAFILLVIPAIVCYLIKGKGKWIKHLLFVCFIITVAMADVMLKYNVTLFMVLPVILAARYYNKRFTLAAAIATTIIYIFSAWVGINVGEQDLNIYNPILPQGTILSIKTTIKSEVAKVDVDEESLLKNTFLQFLLPKIMIYNIVAFACVQISQSGKNIFEKQKEISMKDERINTELNLASNIQKSMLPSKFPPFPDHPEIDIYASMTPAKEVGGDFYDMFLIDDEHLAICIADVSGKGVPAALVMMVSKILLKNVSQIDKNVEVTFNRVNKMLCDGNKSSVFITCWFGILNLKSGNLEFVNAGHNPPLLYSNKTGKYEYLRTKANLVLAGMEDFKYSKNEIALEPGDRLFLYTDGVVEGVNSENELYGEDRLREFVNENSFDTAKESINGVKENLKEFVGNVEQFDDITMLELFYKCEIADEKVKVFKANKEELYNVQEFIEKVLKDKVPSSKMSQINLAVEEVFVNIANYAYEGKDGECLVKIKVIGDEAIFTFEDSGIQFNPLEKTDPDTNLSANERDIGGLGIYLTKKIMDNVEYKYKNNKNILVLTSKL